MPPRRPRDDGTFTSVAGARLPARLLFCVGRLADGFASIALAASLGPGVALAGVVSLRR